MMEPFKLIFIMGEIVVNEYHANEEKALERYAEVVLISDFATLLMVGGSQLIVLKRYSKESI